MVKATFDNSLTVHVQREPHGIVYRHQAQQGLPLEHYKTRLKSLEHFTKSTVLSVHLFHFLHSLANSSRHLHVLEAMGAMLVIKQLRMCFPHMAASQKEVTICIHS
jgi:hypothetical protein